jgi:hypothetical protein
VSQQQQAANGKQQQHQQQSVAAADGSAGVSLFTPGLLALSCCSVAAAGSKGSKRSSKQTRKQQQNGSSEQLPSLKLYQLLNSAPDAAELSSDGFKLALLGCSVATASRACQLSGGCGVAAPEVLQPLLSAVAALLLGVQGLPAAAESALQRLQQQLQQTSDDVVATRLPMVQSHRWVVRLLLLHLAAWGQVTHSGNAWLCSLSLYAADIAVDNVSNPSAACRTPMHGSAVLQVTAPVLLHTPSLYMICCKRFFVFSSHIHATCRVKLVAPREFNPRYEADFAAGADYDPDRQRSEARKLQRQLVKERRGAMRELRRDSVFMSAVSLLRL